MESNGICYPLARRFGAPARLVSFRFVGRKKQDTTAEHSYVSF